MTLRHPKTPPLPSQTPITTPLRPARGSVGPPADTHGQYPERDTPSRRAIMDTGKPGRSSHMRAYESPTPWSSRSRRRLFLKNRSRAQAP